MRGRSIEWIGLAAAVVATLIIYGFFAVHPYPASPLSEFLAMFGRNAAAVWPMQLVWYAGALVIIGLALWSVQSRRRATQAICVLLAAYLAWIGIGYFGVLNSGMNFAWFWAAVFSLQGILFLVAGFARRDLARQRDFERDG